MMDKYDRESTDNKIVGQRKLSYGEFEHVSILIDFLSVERFSFKSWIFQLCCELKSKEVSQTFKKVVSKKDNIQTHGGMSEASAQGE